ncbi:LOW QUALITY PROTEIN: hypothetical protein TMIG_03706, partial [Mycobacterium tuberculosis SUMu009]
RRCAHVGVAHQRPHSGRSGCPV